MLDHFCGAVPLGSYRGVATRTRLWTPGSNLRVAFLGGSQALRERVLSVASEWSQWANITFTRVESAANAQIRVGFSYGGGCWSYVGKDALRDEFVGKPTMNLSWIAEDTPQREFKRLVLHEFGHALGLEHEHKSPKSPIVWNEAAVIDYYRTTHGWGEAYTRMNVLDRIVEVGESTNFDPYSIMLYPIAPELTIDGQGVPWLNSELSDTDKAFVSALYPGPV